MPVIINFKICDNAKECDGIEACKTHALYWDSKNETVAIDNSKCTSCGLCAKECPVSAILVAKTDDEYEHLTEIVSSDIRTRDELMVERYGAVLITPEIAINESMFETEVLKEKGKVIVEFYTDDSVHCLLQSVPYKDIISKFKNAKLRKINCTGKSAFAKKYKVTAFPSLVVFQNSKPVGMILGFENNVDTLRKKVSELI